MPAGAAFMGESWRPRFCPGVDPAVPSQTPSRTEPEAMSPRDSDRAVIRRPRHSLAEDIQGLTIAAAVSVLGMSIFAAGGMMLGGMAGVSLLLHYATGWPFGVLFVLVNLPFYLLSMRRMGWEFTLKTFIAVGITGFVADMLPRLAEFAFITPVYSAVFGGALVGMGILSFIRHRASLGGLGILAVYLQQRRGWSAGKVQMAFDTCIMLAALSVLEPSKVAWSALGALVLNLVLYFNHRPGRYMGV